MKRVKNIDLRQEKWGPTKTYQANKGLYDEILSDPKNKEAETTSFHYSYLWLPGSRTITRWYGQWLILPKT